MLSEFCTESYTNFDESGRRPAINIIQTFKLYSTTVVSTSLYLLQRLAARKDYL
jgi:hypothetical protein